MAVKAEPEVKEEEVDVEVKAEDGGADSTAPDCNIEHPAAIK